MSNLFVFLEIPLGAFAESGIFVLGSVAVCITMYKYFTFQLKTKDDIIKEQRNEIRDLYAKREQDQKEDMELTFKMQNTLQNIIDKTQGMPDQVKKAIAMDLQETRNAIIRHIDNIIK